MVTARAGLETWVQKKFKQLDVVIMEILVLLDGHMHLRSK